MTIADVVSLLGGIALFLFGMSLMGEGLKKVAGSRLELYLAENAVVKDGQRQVLLPCSLSEFAGLLCVGRASLYRTLDAMEAEGRIRRQGRTIYLAEEL